MVLDRKILLNYAEGLGRGQKTQPFLLYNTAFTILEDIYVVIPILASFSTIHS